MGKLSTMLINVSYEVRNRIEVKGYPEKKDSVQVNRIIHTETVPNHEIHKSHLIHDIDISHCFKKRQLNQTKVMASTFLAKSTVVKI
jgi:hypothetical protein